MRKMDTTPETHVLFFDMQEIAQLHNLKQSVVEATKHPLNPILPLGDLSEWDSGQARPWEARTVLFDEEDGLFKLWYAGTDLSTERWWKTGYATSADGVVWDKPSLGLCEYNGNKDNNICMESFGPVIKDLSEKDPARRFKALVKGPPLELGVRAKYSPDGIHWTEGPRLDFPEWEGAAPDMVVFLRDEQDPDPARRYKMVWQSTDKANKPGPERIRIKNLAYSPDGETWTSSPHNPILNPNDSTEQENHFLMIIPYKGWYICLYEYAWYCPNRTGIFGSYCGDIRLAASRDGLNYTRILSSEKTISRGPRGAWDDGFLVISDKAVIRDDRIYVYYCGNGEDWTSWPAENIPEGFPYPSSGCVRSSRMGLATLKLDRFTCLQTCDGETPGSAVTAPIRVTDAAGARLVVNVSDVRQRRDWVEVAVLDASTGNPIPGYTRQDCVDLDVDRIDAAVRWKDATLAGVSAERIRLKFYIYGAAKLYSFHFERCD